MNASLKFRRDYRPVFPFYLSSLRRTLNPSFGLLVDWMSNGGQPMLKDSKAEAPPNLDAH